MCLERRSFMAGLAALAPMTAAGHPGRRPRPMPGCSWVFLRGAYDAASIVIPVGSDFYRESRPTLAIAKPDAAVATSAMPLDADWGLHPSLAGSVLPLWKQGHVAFVAIRRN